MHACSGSTYLTAVTAYVEESNQELNQGPIRESRDVSIGYFLKLVFSRTATSGDSLSPESGDSLSPESGNSLFSEVTKSENEEPGGVLRNRIRSTAVNQMICAIHVRI